MMSHPEAGPAQPWAVALLNGPRRRDLMAWLELVNGNPGGHPHTRAQVHL